MRKLRYRPGRSVAPPTTSQPSPDTLSEHLVGILLLGAVGLALAYVPAPVIGFDQFAYPKELVYQLFACVALALGLANRDGRALAGWQLPLLMFLLIAVASSAGATNTGESVRQVGLWAGAGTFMWVAWNLARQGKAWTMMMIVAVMCIAAAATALLEAFGIVAPISDPLAPGGTLGDRNFLAHVLVLGLPSIALLSFQVRRSLLPWTCAALVMVAMTVVLTRCRDAWAACIVMLIVAGATAFLMRGRMHSGHLRRGLLAGACLAVGATIATQAPNALRWASVAPYEQSIREIATVASGGGKGRVIQYRNTVKMIVAHPLLGVAPGNWHLRYPSFASVRDPSYEPSSAMPVNRLPQSDWLAITAETGVFALLCLGLCAYMLICNAMRTSLTGVPWAAERAIGLVATLAGVVVLGFVDAVIQQPAPLMVSAIAIGALSAPGRLLAGSKFVAATKVGASGFVALLLVACWFAGQRLTAGVFYGRDLTIANLATAVRINPREFRSQLMLGRELVVSGRCDLAVTPLNVAHALFPEALSPQMYLDRCQSLVAKPTGRAIPLDEIFGAVPAQRARNVQ